MTPGIAGIQAATFAVGTVASVVGTDATATCVTGHICDSFSGTLRLITGSGPISSAGTPAVIITLPLSRANLPNCLVTFTTKAGSKSIAMALDYPNTSSITITANNVLSSATADDITYLCGGN
jgi:hypothetical protein